MALDPLAAAAQADRWRALRDPLALAAAELRDGHIHPVPTLVLPLRGAAQVRWRGGHIDLAPGEALLIAAATRHAHPRLRPGAACLHLGFKGPWCDVAIESGGRRVERHVPAAGLRPLVDGMLDAAPAAGLRLLRRFLHAVAAAPEADCFHAAPSRALARMTQFLWKNFDRPIAASAVLAACGLGRSRAHALFSAAYGHGPAAELERLRLETARALLAGGLGVAATARRCGYADRRRFTRACTRVWGHPPRALAPAPGDWPSDNQ